MRQRPKLKKRIKRRDLSAKRRSVLFIVILFLLLLSCGGIVFLFSPRITVTFRGERVGSTITIHYREKYKSPEYHASYLQKDITDQVEVLGKVDTSRLGEYKIYYRVKEGVFFKTKVIRVRVRDLSAPALSLHGKKTTNVCPGGKYQEEGYKAYDNVDGDITKRVKVKKIRDRILYSVSDRAGNYKEVTRKLVYQDIEKPTIKLKGDFYQTIYVGEKYEDSGVEVSDNCDQDLSSRITVKGHVDTQKCGIYKLIYTVSDQAGNESRIERQVNVVEHGQKGTIYLTFDDGPKAGTTDVILDILKEEGVKATFFITNGGPDELVIREQEEGHTVGLHTASHDYSYVYSSVDHYYQDLYAVRDRVKRLTGQTATIIRFPGGSSNTISRRYANGIMSTLTQDVLQKGFYYFDWNLASGDAGELHTAESIYENVVHLLSKDRVNVVLMHDIKPYTRDALRNIIRYAKENGYVFDKITERTEMMHQKVNN